MSDYAQITLFTPKDALITGNPLKLVRGSEIDAELTAIGVAIATKYDSTDFANPAGTVGLAAVNGVASTLMRSDAAPALSQAIAPTWSGQHTWSLSLRAPDGLVGTPAVTFTSDPDTGVYRTGANTIGFSGGGVRGFQVDGGHAYIEDGLVGSPSLTFNSDTDTGIYRVGADSLGVAVGGVFSFGVTTTDTRVNHATVPQLSLYVSGTERTFIRYTEATSITRFDSDGTLSLAANNVVALTLTPVAAPQVTILDGAVGLPSLAFISDPDTGIYRVGANTVGIAGGGVFGLKIDGGHAYLADGAVGAPALTFDSDINTGMYSGGGDNLRFATGGVKALEIDSSQRMFDKNGFELGYKQIPRSTTATTLASTDVGKCVAITAAINIPISVFSAGDAISIYNDSAGALNITISAGTLRLAGTATTGTRSLAARGIATLWFNVGGATPEVIASGNVT